MPERAHTVRLDGRDRQLAEEVVRRLDAGARLSLVGASGEPLAVTGSVLDAVTAALVRALKGEPPDGEALAGIDADAGLTVEQAALILDIAPAMVGHRMDTGRLPFRTVGDQRRLPVAEVLRVRVEDGRHATAMRAMYDAFDDRDPAPAP